jgi:hypothetical protein
MIFLNNKKCFRNKPAPTDSDNQDRSVSVGMRWQNLWKNDIGETLSVVVQMIYHSSGCYYIESHARNAACTCFHNGLLANSPQAMGMTKRSRLCKYPQAGVALHKVEREYLKRKQAFPVLATDCRNHTPNSFFYPDDFG